MLDPLLRTIPDREWLLMGTGFLLGWWEYSKLVLVMAAQFCEYSKKQRIEWYANYVI